MSCDRRPVSELNCVPTALVVAARELRVAEQAVSGRAPRIRSRSRWTASRMASSSKEPPLSLRHPQRTPRHFRHHDILRHLGQDTSQLARARARAGNVAILDQREPRTTHAARRTELARGTRLQRRAHRATMFSGRHALPHSANPVARDVAERRGKAHAGIHVAPRIDKGRRAAGAAVAFRRVNLPPRNGRRRIRTHLATYGVISEEEAKALARRAMDEDIAVSVGPRRHRGIKSELTIELLGKRR